jgi:hypothetical protein
VVRGVGRANTVSIVDREVVTQVTVERSVLRLEEHRECLLLTLCRSNNGNRVSSVQRAVEQVVN